MDICSMRALLQKLWIEEKWTLTQLADQIGLHPATIKGFLMEWKIPHHRTAVCIKEFLDVYAKQQAAFKKVSDDQQPYGSREVDA